MEMIERVKDVYLDWKIRQVSRGVRLARHSLCEGYETHKPTDLKRLERRSFKAFEDAYLRKSIRQVQQMRDLRHAHELRLAQRDGYEQAGVRTTELVTYLEDMGASEIGEENAIETVLRVLDGYRERNNVLEAARLEADEIISGLEVELETAKDDTRKARKQTVQYKSELSILREQHEAAATRTGALSVARRTGSGTHTDSIRTIRVAGVDQASR